MKKEWIEILLKAVYEASDKIMEIYTSGFEVEYKEDRSPVTLADTESSKIIYKHLLPLGLPIVSEEEENPPYEERNKSEFLWMVDPLDGTQEFIRENDEFCICIALIQENKAIFGIIADPVNREVIFGGTSTGTASHISFYDEDYLSPMNQKELQLPDQKSLVYSRSNFSPKVVDIVEKIELLHGKMNVIKKGSALKFFDLVLSKAQFYPRLAPTMEWDIAAGQAIYEAIGGEVVDFTNFKELTYNKEDLYNPYFIAKPKGLEIH